MGIRSLAAVATATIASSLVLCSVVFAQSGQCSNAASKIQKLQTQITAIEVKNEATIDKLVTRGLERIARMREKAANRQASLRAKITALQACATPTPSPTATPTPSPTPAPTA